MLKDRLETEGGDTREAIAYEHKIPSSEYERAIINKDHGKVSMLENGSCG